VTYDQLGCGQSDRPTDPRLWTIARYVEEVETVRKALTLAASICMAIAGRLAGIEYALTYPKNLKTSCSPIPAATCLIWFRSERLRALWDRKRSP